MPERSVDEMVRTTVAEALERQLPRWRETVVEEVLREIRPVLDRNSAPPAASIAGLQKAVSAIQAGCTQKEILRALLDHLILYSGRAALFVVKNGAATGWQGASLGSPDAIKDFALDISSGLAARVLETRKAASGAIEQFDKHFTAKFGAPADQKLLLLPLLLKDKVSALVYADAGSEGGSLDGAALDVLVRATSTWLEVVSQRKQAQKEGTAEAEMHPPAPASDPFAAHAPIHAAKPAAAAAAWGAAGAAVGGEDAEVHRKAQRFARLLIDEIKLYNQAKVAEGRRHKDLYDRLKDDIEKSRTTYQKRYGNTMAAAADYFNQELIRSLAEDDASLLGANFQRSIGQ
jgi:hypothetical protein